MTGDFGSGKTTFLRLLEKHEAGRDRRTVTFNSLTAGDDEVIINGLFGDADETMKLLAAAGLSKAYEGMHRYYR